MSTTNSPTPGGPAGPQPGAGREWPNDAADGSRGDDSGGGGGVDPQAIRTGHEPDAFAVKPIIGVPVAVGAAFVLAFVVTSLVFGYFMTRADDPMAHPIASERSKAETNDRLARIESEKTTGTKEVDQPRLEGLQQLTNNGATTTQTPIGPGNSPYYHPEDLWAANVPGLHRTEWVGKDKKVARIPIDEAMKMLAAPGKLAVAKDKVDPAALGRYPTAASAGRTSTAARQGAAGVKAAHEDHPESHKADPHPAKNEKAPSTPPAKEGKKDDKAETGGKTETAPPPAKKDTPGAKKDAPAGKTEQPAAKTDTGTEKK